MLIDGNDDRGIDVGLLTRTPHEILSVRSHVDDQDDEGLVFSRDCPEYELAVPGGPPLLVLINHFKSKGYRPPAESTARRKRQAQRVKAIYDQRRAEGHERIAVLGDLNDTPDSPALAPLMATDLQDASTIPGFDSGPRRGTFATGNDKIDYLLLSPALPCTPAGSSARASGTGPRSRTHGRSTTPSPTPPRPPLTTPPSGSTSTSPRRNGPTEPRPALGPRPTAGFRFAQPYGCAITRLM